MRMFYSLLVAFKQVRDGTDVPKDDSGLFESAATSPAGSPTTSRQVSFRGAVGTATPAVEDEGRSSGLVAGRICNEDGLRAAELQHHYCTRTVRHV